MRTHVILAVLKRNLMSYFTRLLGYLLIVAFVGLASVSLFNAQFFTNNLANLDQLTEQFPYLLLFIIPAITMTAWADENGKANFRNDIYQRDRRDAEALTQVASL